MDNEANFTWLIILVCGWLSFAVIRDILISTLTELHRHTIDGNYQRAKKLLDGGTNPDITKNKGMTPLFYAIIEDRREILELLLDYGADIDLEFNGAWFPLLGKHCFNPLLSSIVLNRPEITRLLVDRGAKQGIHYFCAIGDVEAVARLLEDSPELINSKFNALGVLHFSVFSGKLALIDLLLAKGADINELSEMKGTIMHLAIIRGDIDLVRYLLELGADLEIPFAKCTSLSIAVSSNNISLIELLIKAGANLNPRGHNIAFPLLVAIEGGHLEAASILLKNGADIDRKQSFTGDTALHKAVSNNDLLMTDLLIHSGAYIDAVGRVGSTPLGISHKLRGSEAVKQLLLQYGASNYGLND
jgi:uncharacterized protein